MHLKIGILVALLSATPVSSQSLSGNCSDTDGDYGSLIRRFESGSLGGTATNPTSTATGTYQFLYGTLAELGYIDRSASSRPSFGAGEWHNVVWTGQDGVRSRADFMASEAAQAMALQRFTDQNLRAISGSFQEGQVYNGIPMTRGGAAAATHMLGAGGFRQWAASGFSPSGLNAAHARAHGWTPEQYNDHLMQRVAAGGCYDPSDIEAAAGEGDMEDVPKIFLMPFGEQIYRSRVMPGQIGTLL